MFIFLIFTSPLDKCEDMHFTEINEIESLIGKTTIENLNLVSSRNSKNNDKLVKLILSQNNNDQDFLKKLLKCHYERIITFEELNDLVNISKISKKEAITKLDESKKLFYDKVNNVERDIERLYQIYADNQKAIKENKLNKINIKEYKETLEKNLPQDVKLVESGYRQSHPDVPTFRLELKKEAQSFLGKIISKLNKKNVTLDTDPLEIRGGFYAPSNERPTVRISADAIVGINSPAISEKKELFIHELFHFSQDKINPNSFLNVEQICQKCDFYRYLSYEEIPAYLKSIRISETSLVQHLNYIFNEQINTKNLLNYRNFLEQYSKLDKFKKDALKIKVRNLFAYMELLEKITDEILKRNQLVNKLLKSETPKITSKGDWTLLEFKSISIRVSSKDLEKNSIQNILNEKTKWIQDFNEKLKNSSYKKHQSKIFGLQRFTSVKDHFPEFLYSIYESRHIPGKRSVFTELMKWVP